MLASLAKKILWHPFSRKFVFFSVDKRFHTVAFCCRSSPAANQRGDENNSLISERGGADDGIPEVKEAKRLLCVIILNHDTLRALMFALFGGGGADVVTPRYANKILKLPILCYHKSVMLYIHCNFTSNIKIAFVITHVKIMFVRRWWAEAGGVFRCAKNNSLSGSTSLEHNLTYLRQMAGKKGEHCQHLSFSSSLEQGMSISFDDFIQRLS